MQKILLLTLFLGLSAQASNHSKWQWQASIGLSGSYQSSNLGTNKSDTSTSISPGFEVIYDDRFFFGSNGIGVALYRKENIELMAGLGYDFGYKASDFDTKALKALGDVNSSAEAMVLFNTHLDNNISISTQIMRGLEKKGHNSWHGNIGLSFDLPYYNIGAFLHYSSKIYQQTYYGVNNKQAAASGLAKFSPSSGIDYYGISLNTDYEIDEDWVAVAGVEYKQFAGGAKDSPISLKDNSSSLSAGIVYRF